MVSGQLSQEMRNKQQFLNVGEKVLTLTAHILNVGQNWLGNDTTTHYSLR